MSRFTRCEWCDRPIGGGVGALCVSCDQREIWRLNPIWRFYEHQQRDCVEEEKQDNPAIVGTELVRTPVSSETLSIRKRDGVVRGDGGARRIALDGMQALSREFPSLPRGRMSWPRGVEA